MPLETKYKNTVTINTLIAREARVFLDSLVHGTRGHGQVLSQILLAEKARREERERIARDLAHTGDLR
jgi:hypothetical protein